MRERSSMRPITAEWIAKAEADFATLESEAALALQLP